MYQWLCLLEDSFPAGLLAFIVSGGAISTGQDIGSPFLQSRLSLQPFQLFLKDKVSNNKNLKK